MNWITLLGFVAAISTTVSFFPQLVKTIKTKHTKDLSIIMYSLLSFGILMWFIYGLLIKDMPVILANGVAVVFSIIILTYKIIYK